MDYGQTGCFSANVDDTYYGILTPVSGRVRMNVGASGLRRGGMFEHEAHAPTAGLEHGHDSLAYVHVPGSRSTRPSALYTASIWASDGQGHAASAGSPWNVWTRCGD